METLGNANKQTEKKNQEKENRKSEKKPSVTHNPTSQI